MCINYSKLSGEDLSGQAYRGEECEDRKRESPVSLIILIYHNLNLNPSIQSALQYSALFSFQHFRRNDTLIGTGLTAKRNYTSF
jgi:hypothetical protein